MGVSKRAKAKMGISKRAKTMKEKSSNNSDDEDDVVPSSALMQRKIADGSDGEEDDVPLVSLMPKPNTNFIADVRADVAVPKGEACIGLEVARDFDGSHGVCKGSIVSVDSNESEATSLPCIVRRR
jgi:hypothetical protein